jgi:hypothetical protein
MSRTLRKTFQLSFKFFDEETFLNVIVFTIPSSGQILVDDSS